MGTIPQSVTEKKKEDLFTKSEIKLMAPILKALGEMRMRERERKETERRIMAVAMKKRK